MSKLFLESLSYDEKSASNNTPPNNASQPAPPPLTHTVETVEKVPFQKLIFEKWEGNTKKRLVFGAPHNILVRFWLFFSLLWEIFLNIFRTTGFSTVSLGGCQMIGGKLKTQIAITLLAIVMTSCMSSVTPTDYPETTPVLLFTQVPSKTPIPTDFYTPTFTAIPTTEMPLSTQTTAAIITPEPILSMLNPTKTKVFVIGITNEGERNYSLGDGTPFRILYEPEGGFMSLGIVIVLSSRLKELPISQVTSLTSKW